MFNRSWFLFASFNLVNMQGFGFEYALMPAINYLYKDDEEGKKAALIRHASFFNCTYETAPFIMGLIASMEKENSRDKSFDVESINAVKAALMGPLSGIGDSVFWGTVRLIAAGIGISLGMQGNILGPILFMLIYHIPSIISRYALLQLGYTTGVRFLSQTFKSGIFETITYCAGVVGMIMLGSMTATNVKIATTLKMNVGGGAIIELQKILDSIMPGLLPLALTLILLVLIRKKIKVMQLLFGVIAFGILGAVVGIF